MDVGLILRNMNSGLFSAAEMLNFPTFQANKPTAASTSSCRKLPTRCHEEREAWPHAKKIPMQTHRDSLRQWLDGAT